MQHRALNIFSKYIDKLFLTKKLEKKLSKIILLKSQKLFFSSIWLVWSIGKVKTHSFTLKLVLSNFMIFKGKDFIQYASNKQTCLKNYLTPKNKEIKIMKVETLFRINLFYLPNLPPKSWTTFYRESLVNIIIFIIILSLV